MPSNCRSSSTSAWPSSWSGGQQEDQGEEAPCRVVDPSAFLQAQQFLEKAMEVSKVLHPDIVCKGIPAACAHPFGLRFASSLARTGAPGKGSEALRES